MKDFSISELRIVHLYKGTAFGAEIHYMHMSQVDTFIAAQLRLHNELERNPYSQEKTARLKEIYVGPLSIETNSYWWCSPTLAGVGAQLNDAPALLAKVWSSFASEA